MENSKSQKLLRIFEVIVSFLDPNSKIYCDDCINSIKQFINNTATVKVTSKDKGKPANNYVEPADADLDKPKNFTIKMVGKPEVHFSDLSLEDFTKKLFGF